MRGLLNLDAVCLTEIFKNLSPLDLCSIRQCKKSLHNFVDDHLHTDYFVREQMLDLTEESNENVVKILKYFGKFVCHMKVLEKVTELNFMLDLIAISCSDILKSLTLIGLQLYEIDMLKFVGVFENLAILELIHCTGDPKYIANFLLGHEYPNLTTLKVQDISGVGTEVLKMFFMIKRSIKHLSCSWVRDDILPLIVLNAADVEELDIMLWEESTAGNVMSLAHLRKLKRLKIGSTLYPIPIITLVKELSINTQLEMLGIYNSEISEDFCDALSNLTNLKELRFWYGLFTVNDTKSIEMMCRKLPQLESLMLVHCSNFPYRTFFRSICKSDKFRTIYACACILETDTFIDMMLTDFIDRKGHRCFVSGNPLCIYLEKAMFNDMNRLLNEDNLKSIEKYGNIKIFCANDDVFSN